MSGPEILQATVRETICSLVVSLVPGEGPSKVFFNRTPVKRKKKIQCALLAGFNVPFRARQ